MLTPRQFPDSRGVFLEWFSTGAFTSAIGHPLHLAQANCSVSSRGTLRGVHFADVPPGQAKYVTCATGAVLDVVFNIRVGSPTYGTHHAVLLDTVAALQSMGTPAPGIPLPPDRPFDLGGGALRSAPLGQAPVPGGRSVSSGQSQRSAALYYAEAEGASTGFRHQDPMALLIAQTFVPLRASAQGF